MSNLASLLNATLPEYAALVAENARLREAEGNYLGALRTANETIARLEAENERLRQDLRAAKDQVERIDAHALLLQDQAGVLRGAAEKAIPEIRCLYQQLTRRRIENARPCDHSVVDALNALTSALAATAPEEGA